MQTIVSRLNRIADRLQPRLFLWIALMVIVPRVAFLAMKPQRNIYGNAAGLLAIADNLASGHGYRNDAGQPDGYFEPLYPVTIAFCNVVPGNSNLELKLLQIGFDVVTVLTLCALMSGAFTTTGLLLLGAFFALHPAFIHLTNNIDQEPLFTCLVTMSVFLLYRALRQGTVAAFGWAGLVTALATLSKASITFLPFAAAVALWWIERKRNPTRVRHWVTYLAAYGCVLLPWAYRNSQVFGHFSVSVRGLATSLWWGSDPRIFTAPAIKEQREAAVHSEQEMAAKGIVRPAKYDPFSYEQWRLQMAMENYKDMLRHPVAAIKIWSMKAARTLYATEDRPQVHPLIMTLQFPLFLLAVIGFVRLWRQPSSRTLAVVLLLFVGYFYAAVTASFPMLRYFVPALPLMLIGSVAGLSSALLKGAPSTTLVHAPETEVLSFAWLGDRLDGLGKLAEPRLLVWVALLVLLPRIGFIALKPDRNIYGNAPPMIAIADNLIAGNGFRDDAGNLDAYFGPVYPALLVVAKLVPGKWALWIKLLHCVCSLISVLLLARLMRPRFSAAGVLVFAAIYAVHPVFLHYANNINQEPVMFMLVVASFYALHRAVTERAIGWYAASGGLMALATLTKGTSLLLPLAIAGVGWLVWRKTNPQVLLHWATYVCVYAVVLLPWAYRNHVVFGHWSVTVGGFGHGFWWGSDPEIFGRYGDERAKAAAAAAVRLEQCGFARPANPTVFDNEHWWFQLGLHNYKKMLTRPGYAAEVLFEKFTRTVYATEYRSSAHWRLLVIQLPLLFLAALGLWRMSRLPEYRPLTILCLIYVTYFYFIVSMNMPMLRYFAPVLPLLLVAAVAGLSPRFLRR